MWAMSVLMSVSDLHFSCGESWSFQMRPAGPVGFPVGGADAGAWNSNASSFHLAVTVGAQQPYCASRTILQILPD